MSAAMADLEQQKAEKETEAATLDVAEEEVKLTGEKPSDEGSKEPEIDLKDRDPNRMNDHVKVRFAEIFGEPDEEIHSFDRVWCLSYTLFSATKTWCYRITSLILGIPLALLWGIVFACLAFCNNWCCMPCLRCIYIDFFPLQKIWNTCIATFIAPCWEAIGLIFSKININMDSKKSIV